ncbi:MAG: hypothetical protein ACK4GJ_01050 [bacterium]
MNEIIIYELENYRKNLLRKKKTNFLFLSFVVFLFFGSCCFTIIFPQCSHVEGGLSGRICYVFILLFFLLNSLFLIYLSIYSFLDKDFSFFVKSKLFESLRNQRLTLKDGEVVHIVDIGFTDVNGKKMYDVFSKVFMSVEKKPYESFYVYNYYTERNIFIFSYKGLDIETMEIKLRKPMRNSSIHRTVFHAIIYSIPLSSTIGSLLSYSESKDEFSDFYGIMLKEDKLYLVRKIESEIEIDDLNFKAFNKLNEKEVEKISNILLNRIEYIIKYLK